MTHHIYFTSKELKNYNIQSALEELGFSGTTYSSIF